MIGLQPLQHCVAAVKLGDIVADNAGLLLLLGGVASLTAPARWLGDSCMAHGVFQPRSFELLQVEHFFANLVVSVQ